MFLNKRPQLYSVVSILCIPRKQLRLKILNKYNFSFSSYYPLGRFTEQIEIFINYTISSFNWFYHLTSNYI